MEKENSLFVTHQPNATTIAAIEEAKVLQQSYREGKMVPEPVSLTSVESMLKSLGHEGTDTFPSAENDIIRK